MRYNAAVEPDPSLINLPHAATVLGRLFHYLEFREEPTPVEQTQIGEILSEMEQLLNPYHTDPPADVAVAAAADVAGHGRRLVEEIVRARYRGDRLGQCVRNLFECLGLPEEGAALSLDCGERPDSPLRP